MSRRSSSIVAAVCPRCGGSLELTEDHERFFTCRNCGTALEDTEYGSGSPQVVNVTVVGRAPQPLSRRAKVVLVVLGAAVLVALIAAVVTEDGGAQDDPDRLTIGSVVGGDEDRRILATGTTFDGMVRAVFTGLADGTPSWSVDVTTNGSAQPRTAVGDDTVYVLVERKLFGLSSADGSERFAVDLPNDLACPDCLVATGEGGSRATVVLNGGAVQSYAFDDGRLVSETSAGAASYWVVAVGETVAFVRSEAQDVVIADPDRLDVATPLELDCPDPLAYGDDDGSIDDIRIGRIDDDVLVVYDECMARWSTDPVAQVWTVESVRTLGDRLELSPDLVRPLGEGSVAFVDLRTGDVRPTSLDPTSVKTVGRSDDATTLLVREDGVWSIVALDAATGDVRWRRTPPGEHDTSFRTGILQALPQRPEQAWVAGTAGGDVHFVRHDATRSSIGVQRIDLVTGDAGEEVLVEYGDEPGVRLPVVLGFTESGVIVTLDDRITHIDTATGEILAEA